jgi:WD40 repeat protein
MPDGRAVDDILKVSVMSLSGSVLGTATVSSKSSVWELKSSIVLAIPQLHMHQRRITLMHGPQILADATPVHEAGIVNGTVLSVILTPAYNMLVSRGDVAELWNHEGRLDGVFFGHTSEINTVNFSPDVTLAITSSWDCSAKLWQVASQVCLFTLWHEAPVDSAAFNLAGTTVLTATLLHEMKLWCVSSGHCVSALSLHGHGQIEFVFTSQGVNVLHTRAHCIALWNMETAPACGSITPDLLGRTSRSHACPHVVTGFAPSFRAVRISLTLGTQRHPHTMSKWHKPVATLPTCRFRLTPGAWSLSAQMAK